MEPLTSNEKRISWKRGVLEFQSQMTFLGHTLSFSTSTPFILAPWNGFHFLLPLFSAPRLLLPAPSQRLPLVRSLAQSLLSQLVLSPSSSVFPEMVTLCEPFPYSILRLVPFQIFSPMLQLIPFTSFSHPMYFWLLFLSGFVSFQPINLYKALSSWNVLLMLHCYSMCLSFQTQVSWKSHQHALFLHPHILFIS